MFETVPLLGFLAAVIALVLVPGPNTMIILTHSLGRGRAVGLATVAGVELATVLHTLAGAFGLAALLAAAPLAFTAVKVAGACCLATIGIRTVVAPPVMRSGAETPSLTPLIAFRRAVVTNLLNPKVGLFFIAFLPQFVRPERGPVVVQFFLLGLIVSAVGIAFGSALAIAGSAMTRWLDRHPSFARAQQRVVGSVLVGLAVRLAAAPA